MFHNYVKLIDYKITYGGKEKVSQFIVTLKTVVKQSHAYIYTDFSFVTAATATAKSSVSLDSVRPHRLNELFFFMFIVPFLCQ